MAHLTDMEELLATVLSNTVRDYMREAMNCYMSGAYRGCIVLSYIALFDDLLAKLAELSKVNSKAKTIYKASIKKMNDQEVFESYLIDQLSSNNLLSGLDSSFLNTLRTLRNKSAHPSGHKPSPEEARFVFFEVIDRFLSKPILTTTQLVDELIERLRNKNFFPTSQIDDIQDVVEEEVKNLHEEAYPQLIHKLTDNFISSDSDISKNAGFFLTGLASLDQYKINSLLQKKVIQPKSDDSEYSILILRLITSNSKLFIGLSKASVTRFKNIISDRIENVKASVNDTRFSHPVAVFTSLIDALSEKELTDTFSDELSELFKRNAYSNYLIDALVGLPIIKEQYIEEIKKKAGSSSFDRANHFADSIEDIDKYLAKVTSNKDAFEIIVAVIKAAEWGAFSSQGLVRTKFSGAPNIKSAAEEYINSNKRKSKKYFDEKLSISIKTTEFLEQYLDS